MYIDCVVPSLCESVYTVNNGDNTVLDTLTGCEERI